MNWELIGWALAAWMLLSVLTCWVLWRLGGVGRMLDDEEGR